MHLITTISTALVASLCAFGSIAAPLPINTLQSKEATPSPKFGNKEYHFNFYRMLNDINCQTSPPIVTKLVPTPFMALKGVTVGQNKEDALTPFLDPDKDEDKRHAALYDMLESIKCTDPANTPATAAKRSPLVPEESIPSAPVFSHPIVLPASPNSNGPWDPTTEPPPEKTPSWKSKFNKFSLKQPNPSARMFPSMQGFSESGKKKREEAATEEVFVGPGRDIFVTPPRRPRPPSRVGSPPRFDSPRLDTPSRFDSPPRVGPPPHVGVTGPPLDPLRGKGWTMG
ncbi:hypothetical protein N0V88_003397 [Collariella sp. IMI 366227]|nr:hypothetical protein N0V88_003397 [Collariella sp. IMI 366227]